jgi:adenylyl-sulfate kinase
MTTPKIIWFTGLSGSGKSTLATDLEQWLVKHGHNVKILDGDEVRAKFHTKLGFSREDILANNRLIFQLIQQELPTYDFILVPVIAPFQQTRDEARELFKDQYLEVYVATPLEECERRDVKGLYQKAKRQEITNFIGVDPNTPYETPTHPDITINTTLLDRSTSLQKILQQLELEI